MSITLRQLSDPARRESEGRWALDDGRTGRGQEEREEMEEEGEGGGGGGGGGEGDGRELEGERE